MTIALAPVTLSAPVNLRDLGGLPAGGSRVRSGFAVRADDLSIVTDEVADRLVADGLRAVIDLRSADEVGFTGRGPLGTRSAVSYHHVPLMADIGQADAGKVPLSQATFGELYVRMYETASAQLVTALAIIAHAPGTAAFHCAAGQDRTGVLAATLLLTLGADTETIVTDYGRTGQNSAAIMTRIAPIMAPLMAKYGFDLDEAARAATRKTFSEAPIREFIEVQVARHGDPLTPLRAAGLTDGLIAQLRYRGLEA